MKRTTNRQRRAVAAAFRRLAHGLEDRAAYRNTIGFYRATGLEWTKRLG